MSSPDPIRRTRGDLCPGVLRPWPAADGALVRLRVPGGRVSPASLAALHGVAARYGDDDNVYLTTRANLQVRALPTGPDGHLPGEVVEAITATGLLPAPGHELIRNILVSPLTGLVGGRVDLRPLTDRLDAGLLADPALAGLPGRFLFVLDDGRGDLVDRGCDLGLVALDAETAQLRVGPDRAGLVPLGGAPAGEEAADRLVELARRFVRVRGAGPQAPWHVRELATPLHLAGPEPTPGAAPAGPEPSPGAALAGPEPSPVSAPAGPEPSPVSALAAPAPADPRLPEPSAPLPFGPVAGAEAIEHVEVPGGVVDRALLARLTGPDVRELIVTPWRGVVVVPA